MVALPTAGNRRILHGAMAVVKKILNVLHPFLRGLYAWYGKETRSFRYKGISIQIFPGVFHPGLFFSTKIFIKFLEQLDLHNKKVLELGCGTGLISIYCHRRGARVTASDVSQAAVANTVENSEMNQADIRIVHSDLFANISPNDFDIILINPPYYPKEFKSDSDRAWFCGKHFEYFENMFAQLMANDFKGIVYMILSEDCDHQSIETIGKKNGLNFTERFTDTMMGEKNFIFEITQ